MPNEASSPALESRSDVEQVPEQLLELSFDLFERYSVLQQIVRRLFQSLDNPRILDVGANSPRLWPGFSSLVKSFLPVARCTIADVQITQGLENATIASGLRLPFTDNAFDVVCALDTLEHIPNQDRQLFIQELRRVSRDIVYLTFPYKSISTQWAEKTVESYLEDVLQSPIPQLKEHEEFGLPDLSDIDKFTTDVNGSRSTFRHGNIDIWLFMMLGTHTLRVQSMDMLRQLNIRFNREYAQFDWREPTYRTSYLLSGRRSKSELDEVIDDIRHHESGDLKLSDALEFIRAFTQLALDTRTVVDKDRHIENLERHKDALGRALEERQRYIEQLEAYRDSTAKALEDKERHIVNLETQKDAFQQALAEKNRHIANIEGELGATRRQAAAVAEMQVRVEQIDEAQHSLRESAGRVTQQLQAVEERIDNDLNLLRKRLAEQNSRLTAQEMVTTQVVTSRTWRSLQAMGKVARLILPGKAAEARRPTAAASRAKTRIAADAQMASERPPELLAAKSIYFVCDEPCLGDNRPRNNTLNVRGWALGEDKFDHVEAEIAGLPPEKIAIAASRPDVKKRFPELDKDGRAGFSATIDIRSLEKGQHTLKLRLVQNDRVLRQIETGFEVQHSEYASDYARWIAEFEQPADEVIKLKLDGFERRPVISIVMPVFNTNPDELSGAIESVIAQSYSNWELCIADDASTSAEVRAILLDAESRYENIHVFYSEGHRGISGGLNAALTLASGEYVGLLDHDDTLAPHALAYVVDAINQHPKAELIYSDEDKLDERGERYEPFFKPDWSSDLILSINYVCHFLVLRKELMDRVGEFCSETDGSQDYDYILRASEVAREIVHVPRVLYHWRAGANSTASSIQMKPYTNDASRRALERYCQRTGEPRVESGDLTGSWRIRYSIPRDSRVSIIIASGGNTDILRNNLDGLFSRTEYDNFELVVADNSSGDSILNLAHEFSAEQNNIHYLDCRNQPFNYSRINNAAARECKTPLLLFLNDDISVIRSDWLTSLVELIARPEVGAVGGKLLFPDGNIQHAGVVMGLFDNCGHAFHAMDGSKPHYFAFTHVIRNVSAVTGACLMTNADVFWKVGGFDENRFAVAFNDVDLCLKIGVSGYRVLFTPFALLYHHEAFSKTQRDLIPHPAEVASMQSKWKDVIAADPYYSPNLTRRKADYSLPTLGN